MKLKRWLWILCAVLISTGVYFTIRYGLRPKPIPVMNATQFERPDSIGAVLYRRLRQEVRAERLILLGSSSDLPVSADIWNGFLKTALADQEKVDVLFQAEGTAPQENVANWEVVVYNPAMIQSGEFMKSVTEHMQAGHLVVVVGPTTEITHLNPHSLSRDLDQATQHPVLSLSAVASNPDPTQLAAMQAQCIQVGDADDLRKLDCAEVRAAKALMKKRGAGDWAILERHGLKEYLLFVRH